MQQENSSFWTDIKTFEERLANSPESFCFAKLSEVYLRVGLIDDALHTARQGIAKHPGYLAGHRALAMACQAKGINDECLAALQRVTEALPEDLVSLKLLGQLSLKLGDRNAARQALMTVLDFNPDDVASRMELESLDVSCQDLLSCNAVDEYDDDEIIEDIEILEELDIIEEDETVCELPFIETTAEAVPSTFTAETQHDPLSTSTLAELYVAQGFINKAIDIYRAMLIVNPNNVVVSTRIAELELRKNVPAKPPSLSVDDFYEDEFSDEPYSVPAVSLITNLKVPAQGTADNALATLEAWLDNIRRIRSCR